MTTKEVANMIKSIGIPYAYYQFPETVQSPPFICFYYAGSNDFLADDVNYAKIDRLVIELYTAEKDFTLEEKTEEALMSEGFVWTKEENYIDTEKLYEIIYETNVVITKGEENGE